MCFYRCYALAILTSDSDEFQDANTRFERLTSEILENALNKDDTHEEKRLVKTLHEACGFEQVVLGRRHAKTCHRAYANN